MLREKIADLFLANYSPREIAEQLGCTRENVEYHLSELEQELNFKVLDLSEKLALINLARLERMVKTVYAKAIETADPRMIKAFLDIIAAEDKWRTQVSKVANSEEEVINIERFTQTFSGGSAMYELALTHLQEEWLGESEMSVNDLYDYNIPAEPYSQEIKALSEKVDAILEIEAFVPDVVEDVDD